MGGGEKRGVYVFSYQKNWKAFKYSRQQLKHERKIGKPHFFKRKKGFPRFAFLATDIEPDIYLQAGEAWPKGCLSNLNGVCIYLRASISKHGLRMEGPMNNLEPWGGIDLINFQMPKYSGYKKSTHLC